MNEYKFYMQRYIGDSLEEQPKSIEDEFVGMKYLKCSGLHDYGKIKNLYTESYAETDELRLYIPADVVRENTDIEFEFGFIGTNRRETYMSFIEWISGYKIKYWDTCRNLEVDIVLIDSVDIEDDFLVGSDPFLTVKLKFKNVNGQAKNRLKGQDEILGVKYTNTEYVYL